MPIFTPDRDHERDFRDALGRFATGVTVVTTQTAAGPIAITANSFAAVSLNPPLVLWSPARMSSRFDAFVAAERFAIHVLAAGQNDVARHFTKQGTDFTGVPLTESDTGIPLIEGCLARFECRQHAVHEGGDHVIIVGEVERAAYDDGKPLVFHAGHFGNLV
ncbi:flavin reductase [Haematobacter massiliensis]|uniref:Flavin oxidoreductase n=1 Tax=Haematobacter massiliensis TaxID=195105 RepID=A0A086YBK5_9RHOB|nr:flavin reductase family protein [Haematobacter massiliensis]KFI31655.1 flavin oxidoreductase [Haematobacter massiliensis]OWJ72044.1 flavin reductase [Haematobacter massiliensis]OWJ81548.1 flavin reductase [Haematobacter massiliensis]QBJ24049.1 flavin reductase [Haematobacter massiliensis]